MEAISDKKASYRRILKASSLIGGSSALTILIGVAKTKVVALLLGPAGIGLVGLLTNVMSTASAVGGFGLGKAGTRQIAEASASSPARLATASYALTVTTVLFALSGGFLVALFRVPISELVFADRRYAADVGWVGVGVGFTIVAASQNALLNGMRRIANLATVSVASSVVAAAVGLGALWLYGQEAVLALVLAAPLAAFLVGRLTLVRVGYPKAAGVQRASVLEQCRSLLRLGFPIMLAGLVGTAADLLIRVLVERNYGVTGVGFFQASWTVTNTYLNFVLGALGADFYPKLTAAIHDPQKVNDMVNEQTEVAMLLAGPILIAMMGLAPWVIEILYSSAFAPATLTLRWQVLADVLKIGAWPLVYILLASGAGKRFLLVETLGMGLLTLLCFLTLPALGVEATGVSLLLMFAAYLPLTYYLAHKVTGFQWNGSVVGHAAKLLLAVSVVFSVSFVSQASAAVAACILGVGFGLHGIGKISQLAELGGPLGKIGRLASRLMQRLTSFR